MNPPPDDLGILDPAVAESMFAMRSSGGGALLPEIVRLFAREEPPRIARLPLLAAERKSGDLAQAAHRLAGACAVLGARELQGAALALENAAAAGARAEIAQRLEDLGAAWGRLHAVLLERKLWPTDVP